VDGLVHVEIGDVDAEVADILLDLVTRDTMNQSRVLAETVVGTFRGNGVSMLPQRPHRSAGFAVLKAPDVPSVLIEMGYLSNKAEASKLTNEEYRKKLARTISRVIDRYFTETSKRAAY
jgi:N-acetylmuramoyl-L-alanine amidase